MLGEQLRLTAAFPGFIAAIEAEVGVSDAHVMVVDSDSAGYDLSCPEPDCCAVACWVEPGAVCNGTSCSPPADPSDSCSERLGAGRVDAVADDGVQTSCGLPPGTRYLTSADAALSDRFTCIASVNALGNPYERQAGALLAGLSPAAAGPGRCNHGFLRDDALLVVTLITDADDEASEGDVEAWIDGVVAAKGGRSDAVVMLGLLPDLELIEGGACPDLEIPMGMYPSTGCAIFEPVG